MKHLSARYSILLAFAAIFLTAPAGAEVIVDIPLDAQIDIGLGPAITGFTSFESENGAGFVRKYVTPRGW